MHDNDPKHTSGVIKDWLKEKKIQTLSWPSFSPDLNPIEHLCDELEHRVKIHQLKNAQQLKDLLQDEWRNIEHSILEKLVDSVLSRLREQIKANGYPNRY